MSNRVYRHYKSVGQERWNGRGPLLVAGMIALLAGGALAAGPARDTPTTEAPPTSVLLVTLDTTRADHLGAYGDVAARTPNLDALARRGMRFARCDTAAPVTLVSHATILTGLYPPRHGVRDNGTFTLPSKVETVAERFAAAGRDTAAVVSSVVLARRHGLDQGFARYDDDLGAGYAAGTEVAERTADVATDRALELLSTLRPGFLLWVHYYDAHEEYRPPDRLVRGKGTTALYDGEIAFVDEQFGRLLAALPANTAVVVVGDHGEMLGEHGEATHGLLLYSGVRRVPLIVAGPGALSGETVDCLVRTADVAPTLLALGGLEVPAGLDGRDLLAPDHACGGTTYTESFLPFFAYKWYPLRSISDGRVLYLQAPKPSLYDLERDSGEARDLAAARPALAKLWRGRLTQQLAAEGETLEPTLASGSPLGEEERHELAALGYLSGGAGGTVDASLPDPRNRIDVAARLHRAADRIGQGGCADELRELSAIAAEDPHNFAALSLAAECLRDLGRVSESIDLFRRAAAENPLSAVPPANLGADYLALGRVEEGARELRRALVLDPADAASAVRLAKTLRASGDAAGALAALDSAAAAGGRLSELFVERGTLRAERGELEPALADFREAARRNPQDPVAAEDVARALFRLGRTRESALAFEALVRLVPDRLDAWKTLGALWLELDERDRARAAFRAALRLAVDPKERSELEAMVASLTR